MSKRQARFGSWCVRIGTLALFVFAATISLAQEAAQEATTAESTTADDTPRLERLDQRQIYNRLLKSTCFITAYRPHTREMLFTGTGWLLDADKRLMVTNEHCTRTSDNSVILDEIEVYFPKTFDGKVSSNLQDYLKEPGLKATVIDRDPDCDLALLQLESVPEGIVGLDLSAEGPSAGDRLFTLGGVPRGSEGLWIFATGDVRQVYRRTTGLGHLAQVVESQLPTNPGNSGGPVVNEYGQLVAVHEGGMIGANLVTMHIDLSELRKFLDFSLPLADPDSAELFNRRADARYDDGRYELAIADYTEALKLDSALTEARINRGWAFTHLEDYQTALGDFIEAVEANRENAAAHDGCGLCYRELGQFDKAVASCTEAIRRDPREPSYYQRRANTYLRMEGRQQEELADRSRAVERDGKQTPTYLIDRAQTLRRMERAAEALPDLEAAVSLEPANWHWLYEWGTGLYDAERYDQAVAVFNLALSRNPNHASSYFNRGMAQRAMDRYVEAADSFQQAVNLLPDRAHYYTYLGASLYEVERYQEALAMLTKAIELDPNDPKAYDYRANTRWYMGDKAGHKADWQTAKNLRAKSE